MKKTRMIRFAAVAAAIGFVAIGGLVTMATPVDTLTHASTARTTDVNAQGLAPLIGTFTGDYMNGVPVYRLPSVTVSVNRKAELARIDREDQLARAAQDKALADAAGAASSRLQPVIAAVATRQ